MSVLQCTENFNFFKRPVQLWFLTNKRNIIESKSITIDNADIWNNSIIFIPCKLNLSIALFTSSSIAILTSLHWILVRNINRGMVAAQKGLFMLICKYLHEREQYLRGVKNSRPFWPINPFLHQCMMNYTLAIGAFVINVFGCLSKDKETKVNFSEILGFIRPADPKAIFCRPSTVGAKCPCIKNSIAAFLSECMGISRQKLLWLGWSILLSDWLHLKT